MISFLLFYLFGIPISVLLHEVGHAISLLIFTKERARIYVGSINESNRENFRIGRMHFHINWSYFGYCARGKNTILSRFQKIMFMAGGPIASLLLAFSAYLISLEITHIGTKNFANGMMYCNLFSFIITTIPIKYPKWIGPLAGHPSDGYQIVMALKKIEL